MQREYGITDTFFGGSFGSPWDERTRLDREYVQVDRNALKELWLGKIKASGRCTLITGRLDTSLVASNIFSNDGLLHDAAGSTLKLACGTRVRAKVVVDASGFESKLVAREGKEVCHARNMNHHNTPRSRKTRMHTNTRTRHPPAPIPTPAHPNPYLHPHPHPHLHLTSSRAYALKGWGKLA